MLATRPPIPPSSKAALVWPPSDGNGGVASTGGGGGGGGKGAPGSPSGLVHWMSAMAEHHDVHYMWNGIETKMNASEHHGTQPLQKEPSLSNYHKGILGSICKDKGPGSPLPDTRHNFRWPPTCNPNSLEEGRPPLESPSPQMHGGGNGGLYASSGGPARPGSGGGASTGAHSPPQGSMLVVPQPLKGPPTSTPGAVPPANGTPGRKYQCKMCPQVFVHKSAMQHHSREAHRGDLKPHQCQQCLKSFSSSHQLAQHVRIHTGEKPYKCSYCDRRFKQLSHVQQHTRLHTGERPYKCHLPECGRAFIQLSNLQQHLRDHDSQMERAKSRPFHCNICGKGFASDSSLRTHRSKQHAALIGGAASQSCPICHKICVNAEALMEHMRTSHKDPNTSGTPSIMWGGEDEAGASQLAEDIGKRRTLSHPCPVCGKAYVNEGSLRKHISSHPETASLASPLRMWPCTVCHSVFTQESGLLHHMEHMRMDPKHQFAAQYLLSRAAAERREKEAGPSADLLAAATGPQQQQQQQQPQQSQQHGVVAGQPASSLAALQATHLVH